MKRCLRMALALSIKGLARLLYRFEVRCLSDQELKHWRDVRLCVFLNHTSLLEFLFIGIMPVSFLWQCAGKLVLPAADITMNRPLVGYFFKILAPKMISISRKRDQTWDLFKECIRGNSVVGILPEGRMKRDSGLDKKGHPMSVRGGVADILELMDEGNVLIAYSGGLHHIQVPGRKGLKLFKKLELNYEWMPIRDYKKMIQDQGGVFKTQVIADLEARLAKNTPASQFKYPQSM